MGEIHRYEDPGGSASLGKAKRSRWMQLVTMVESRNTAVRAVLHAGWSIGRRHLLANAELREARAATKPDRFFGRHSQLLLSSVRLLVDLGVHNHRFDELRPLILERRHERRHRVDLYPLHRERAQARQHIGGGHDERIELASLVARIEDSRHELRRGDVVPTWQLFRVAVHHLIPNRSARTSKAAVSVKRPHMVNNVQRRARLTADSARLPATLGRRR